MASALSHAVASAGIGALFYRRSMPTAVWIAGIVCSMVPDVDVIGFRFGIPYGDFWGHRGFTHSLVFAGLLSGVVAATIVRFESKISWFALFGFLFLATASHGLLDAMTNGGLGVAFFSPFENKRYFLPWRPIPVSPIGVERFFTHRGLVVLHGEILYIWVPSVTAISMVLILRRFRPRTAAQS